ncbi:MAG: hypothetical protein B7733_14300 [Myxococcales bacterium FL481]|nr:MAG: hypothetical protein B7733_14300 [Myxococcales bacterium FL481]
MSEFHTAEPTGPGSTRAAAPWQRWGPAALGLAVLCVWAIHARAWQFLCDDAYIAFRYADNLARTGELSFNPGYERVEGFTSPLWVVVLAGLARVGLAPPAVAPALTWIGSGLGLGGVVALARGLAGRHRQPWTSLDILPALGLALLPEYMVWSGSGLETSTTAAAVLWSMWAFHRGNWRLAAGLAASSALLRLDALVPLCCFAAASLGWRQIAGPTALGSGSPRRASVLVALAVFLGPVLLHFVWRHAYYGTWWPNTWHVKQHGVLLRDRFGVAYVASWAQHLALWGWVPLAAWVRPRHVVAALPLGGVVVYAWWVGGDFMGYSRFLVLGTALFATLVAWLLHDAVGWARRRWPETVRRPSVVRAGWLLAIAVGAGLGASAHARHARDLAGGWLEKRFESVQAMHEFAAIRVAVGTEMAAVLPPETRLTVGAAGAVPYASRLYAIDAYGLVDPRADELKPAKGKRARPGHQLRASLEHLHEYQPDLLCHLGAQGPKRPSSKLARRRSGSDRYVWACLDYPRVVDGRAGAYFEAGVYCCLRRRDHAVGPFGGGS